MKPTTLFSPTGSIFLLVYVDDILITGNNQNEIDELIKELHQAFALKDLGEVHNFLGIEISHVANGLHLRQEKYIKDLLQRAGMSSAKAISTPMASSTQLSSSQGSPTVDPTLYISIVGALQYAAITRPDISYSVDKVCQYMQNPLDSHWKVVKRILRYLAGTLSHGLYLQKSSNLNIIGYSDSDWAADLDDRRSTTGFCIFLGSNLISWCSKKQHSVSRSSTEAEYRCLAMAASEVTWIQSLLSELHCLPPQAPVIWIDNQSAIYMAGNPILHARTKHIELDFHFVREKVAAQKLLVQYVPSLDQTADILANH